MRETLRCKHCGKAVSEGIEQDCFGAKSGLHDWSPRVDKVTDRVTLEEPPQLAKLLYRLWQGSRMIPYDAELDGQIVLALQPWVEQLKNGETK